MRNHRLSVFCGLLLAAGVACAADKADTSKLTNVYLLAHAGAILDICAASPDAGAFAPEKSREIGDLSARLATLVRAIGTHYRDRELFGVYEATKANMAADEKLRRHVKVGHENCGSRTLGEMRTYVADNETLINQAIERSRAAPTPKPASAPAR
jgi:hypothetical protein